MKGEKPKEMKGDKSKVKPSDGDWNRNKRLKQTGKEPQKQVETPKVSTNKKKKKVSK